MTDQTIGGKTSTQGRVTLAMRPKIAFLTAIVALAALSAPATASAQAGDSARIAALEAKVTRLEQMLGTGFLDRAPAQSDLVPANELGASGRYPYILSDYQIRVGLAQLATGLQAQITGFGQRLAVVEASGPAAAPSTGAAPFASGNDLIIPTGRLIFGSGCQSDAAAIVQICGQVDANIHVESNINGAQYQN